MSALPRQLSSLTLRSCRATAVSPKILRGTVRAFSKPNKAFLSAIYDAPFTRHYASEARKDMEDTRSEARKDMEEAYEFAEKRDIEEMKRVAELREKVVKEHKERAAKSKFHFPIELVVVWGLVALIVIDYFGLDFWDWDDREKRA